MAQPGPSQTFPQRIIALNFGKKWLAIELDVSTPKGSADHKFTAHAEITAVSQDFGFSMIADTESGYSGDPAISLRQSNYTIKQEDLTKLMIFEDVFTQNNSGDATAYGGTAIAIMPLPKSKMTITGMARARRESGSDQETLASVASFSGAVAKIKTYKKGLVMTSTQIGKEVTSSIGYSTEHIKVRENIVQGSITYDPKTGKVTAS